MIEEGEMALMNDIKMSQCKQKFIYNWYLILVWENMTWSFPDNFPPDSQGKLHLIDNVCEIISWCLSVISDMCVIIWTLFYW